MDTTNEVKSLIGQPPSATLEYKAVLPPSRSMAQIIGSFANTEGGYLILGISADMDGGIEVNGLSEDFYANTITHKALDILVPQPEVHYQYMSFNGKNLYIIRIEKSDSPVSVEGKIYKRADKKIKLINPTEITFKTNGYVKIENIHQQLEMYKSNATQAKTKLIEHYQSILKIIDDLGQILYPEGVNTPTSNQEGKILSRILFSSFVDNFETYLSDLLYEIFLANPQTLKSKQQVTIEEVLNYSDLQDFIKYYAKQKISKLQKGSVKGFIQENRQIRDIMVLDDNYQNDIEKILQIRHLYSHRNGIVDEKFLQYYAGQFDLNIEHQMSISEICDKLQYLAEAAQRIDVAAAAKYRLVQIGS
ncbi:MAG TPA: RNA-binding domain-containing protein [Ktedonobacteraceae bacterium]|nr:RNA-binding domain-containing protein [Ktedonobacteraceae bacterium]